MENVKLLEESKKTYMIKNNLKKPLKFCKSVLKKLKNFDYF